MKVFNYVEMIFAGSRFPCVLTILIVRPFLGRMYLLGLKLYHDRSDHFTDSLTKAIMKLNIYIYIYINKKMKLRF